MHSDNKLALLRPTSELSTPSAWAFADVGDVDEKALIYDSLRNGKSRFGWSQADEHNLKTQEWSDWHAQQLFLLEIKPGDWIVHVNTPAWGECVAVLAAGEYEFDDGLRLDRGIDFRHCIPVDPATLVVFDRRDQNVLPTVNLSPRKRYHRIKAVDDLICSLDNLRRNRVSLKDKETRELFHFRNKTDGLLSDVTAFLQATHKSKNLERFIAEVFRRLPGVVNVHENGSGWCSDNGADLIVTIQANIANIAIDQRVVVQVKSYTDAHYDLAAIEQIEEAMQVYEAVAGIIVTTAQKTEELEAAIQTTSNAIGKPIDLIAGEDVAKFAIKYAPDLVFNLGA